MTFIGRGLHLAEERFGKPWLPPPYSADSVAFRFRVGLPTLQQRFDGVVVLAVGRGISAFLGEQVPLAGGDSPNLARALDRPRAGTFGGASASTTGRDPASRRCGRYLSFVRSSGVFEMKGIAGNEFAESFLQALTDSASLRSVENRHNTVEFCQPGRRVSPFESEQER